MTTKAMSKEAPSTKLASTRETPKLKLQGYCRAVGSLSSSFARFTRKISWPKAGAAGISELTGWPIVPSYFALYRFAGVMEFYLRNGLRAKVLEIKALKNSPPASASARIFSEESFFAVRGLKGLQGPKGRENWRSKPGQRRRILRLPSAFVASRQKKVFCGKGPIGRWGGWLWTPARFCKFALADNYKWLK